MTDTVLHRAQLRTLDVNALKALIVFLDGRSRTDQSRLHQARAEARRRKKKRSKVADHG
jgi:hypothetical protein